MIVPGLLEESRRKILDGLRLFIAVDNRAAVKIRDLHKESRSRKVVKPSFTTDSPEAVLRDDAGEPTLRAHEEGKVFCAPLSTPLILEIKDGDHR